MERLVRRREGASELGLEAVEGLPLRALLVTPNEIADCIR